MKKKDSCNLLLIIVGVLFCVSLVLILSLSAYAAIDPVTDTVFSSNPGTHEMKYKKFKTLHVSNSVNICVDNSTN